MAGNLGVLGCHGRLNPCQHVRQQNIAKTRVLHPYTSYCGILCHSHSVGLCKQSAHFVFGRSYSLYQLSDQKVSAHDVFTVFENGGGWPTTAVSVFVGLLGSVFATYGNYLPELKSSQSDADCMACQVLTVLFMYILPSALQAHEKSSTDIRAQMAEEIHNANVVIPWCIFSTTILNGVLGFAIVIVVLFVTVDIEGVLASPTGLLGFPFMQIFYDATGSLSGASAMISIIIIMDISAAIAFLATSSRIVFAFGRDKGLPFWRTMSTVYRS